MAVVFNATLQALRLLELPCLYFAVSAVYADRTLQTRIKLWTGGEITSNICTHFLDRPINVIIKTHRNLYNFNNVGHLVEDRGQLLN